MPENMVIMSFYFILFVLNTVLMSENYYFNIKNNQLSRLVDIFVLSENGGPVSGSKMYILHILL